jgi:HSP20 family molecular chaperone IbpA
MSIIDKVGALLPWRGQRRLAPPARDDGQFLLDDFDRWLQRLVDEPGRSGFGRALAADVRESDDAVTVTVEVPGIDRDHLDLRVTPEGLTIRGETRHETEDTRDDYRVVQSRYGSFVRTVPLPPGLDLEGAEARVKDGMLTVRFPKVDARPGMRRVPIKA